MTLKELHEQYGEFTIKAKLISQTLARLENEIVKEMEKVNGTKQAESESPK